MNSGWRTSHSPRPSDNDYFWKERKKIIKESLITRRGLPTMSWSRWFLQRRNILRGRRLRVARRRSLYTTVIASVKAPSPLMLRRTLCRQSRWQTAPAGSLTGPSTWTFPAQVFLITKSNLQSKSLLGTSIQIQTWSTAWHLLDTSPREKATRSSAFTPSKPPLPHPEPPRLWRSWPSGMLTATRRGSPRSRSITACSTLILHLVATTRSVLAKRSGPSPKTALATL